MSSQFRLAARLSWTVTRRAWRENTILLPALLLFAATYAVHALRAPRAGREGYLSLLFASGLATAVLVPVQLRAASVLSSARFALLPLDARTVFLLRPLFGNSFRAVLAAVALAGGAASAWAVRPGALGGMLATLQLAGWTLAAVAAAEILEEVLRRRPPAPLWIGVPALMWGAVTLFLAMGRVRPAAPSLPDLLGLGDPSPARRALAAGGALALAALLFPLGGRVARHFAAFPPREGGGVRFGGVGGWVARRLRPRRPATLAKELAAVLRIPAFWGGHAGLALCAAAAFSAGNPPLLAAGFLIWAGAVYNLLGSDVPRGGVVRHALLPLPRGHVLRARHAAVLLVSLAVAVAALAAVTLLRGGSPPPGWRSPEHALWFGYGASLFLLFTLPGDHASLRRPRPLALRGALHEGGGAGTVRGAAFFLGTSLLVLAVAAAVAMGWRVALGPRAGGILPILLSLLTHCALYALGQLRRPRAR